MSDIDQKTEDQFFIRNSVQPRFTKLANEIADTRALVNKKLPNAVTFPTAEVMEVYRGVNAVYGKLESLAILQRQGIETNSDLDNTLKSLLAQHHAEWLKLIKPYKDYLLAAERQGKGTVTFPYPGFKPSMDLILKMALEYCKYIGSDDFEKATKKSAEESVYRTLRSVNNAVHGIASAFGDVIVKAGTSVKKGVTSILTTPLILGLAAAAAIVVAVVVTREG